MASKARMFADDSTLSAILATDDPREHKRLGRQVRHFDHDSCLHERENIALRGNMTNFSQNEDLRLTLLHTGQRRLAEASPYDNLWGIGLKASDYHELSHRTWRGSNPLGQTLEYVRQTLCEITPQISDSPPADNPHPLNQPGNTVFEIDPTTQTRLNTASITEYPHDAALSAFVDSAPDDYTPEVLLTNATRGDKPFISEHCPDLISGVVTMDDVTFTTLPSLTSGASATSQFRCRALLDTASPQSFIHQGAFEQMVATGAADESYVRSTPPRSWNGFGSQEPLNTNRQACLSIHFTTTMRPPHHMRYGYTSSPIKQCDVHSCLVAIAGCVSTLAPTKRLRLHLMAAFSVNPLCRTLLTTLTTVLPRTSAAVRPRTLFTTEYTTVRACPSTPPHNWSR